MGKRKAHEISSEEDSDKEVKSTIKAKKVKVETLHVSNPLLSVADLDPDDEVWIVKLPAHLNVDHLHDQKLPLSNDKSKLLSVGENLNYQARVEKKKRKLPVLLPDSKGHIKAVSLACKGDITLVEALEEPKVGDIKVPPKTYVQQPECFVRRHPFFGPQQLVVSPQKKSKKAKKSKK